MRTWAVVYTIPESVVERWDDPEIWQAANPGLGISVTTDYLADVVFSLSKPVLHPERHRLCDVLTLALRGRGQTRRRHLNAAVELLQQDEVPILGGVLNASTGGQARRRYGYGYSSPRNPYVGSNGKPKKQPRTSARQ